MLKEKTNKTNGLLTLQINGLKSELFKKSYQENMAKILITNLKEEINKIKKNEFIEEFVTHNPILIKTDGLLKNADYNLSFYTELETAFKQHKVFAWGNALTALQQLFVALAKLDKVQDFFDIFQCLAKKGGKPIYKLLFMPIIEIANKENLHTAYEEFKKLYYKDEVDAYKTFLRIDKVTNLNLKPNNDNKTFSNKKSKEKTGKGIFRENTPCCILFLTEIEYHHDETEPFLTEKFSLIIKKLQKIINGSINRKDEKLTTKCENLFKNFIEIFNEDFLEEIPGFIKDNLTLFKTYEEHAKTASGAYLFLRFISPWISTFVKAIKSSILKEQFSKYALDGFFSVFQKKINGLISGKTIDSSSVEENKGKVGKVKTLPDLAKLISNKLNVVLAETSNDSLDIISNFLEKIEKFDNPRMQEIEISDDSNNNIKIESNIAPNEKSVLNLYVSLLKLEEEVELLVNEKDPIKKIKTLISENTSIDKKGLCSWLLLHKVGGENNSKTLIENLAETNRNEAFKFLKEQGLTEEIFLYFCNKNNHGLLENYLETENKDHNVLLTVLCLSIQSNLKVVMRNKIIEKLKLEKVTFNLGIKNCLEIDPDYFDKLKKQNLKPIEEFLLAYAVIHRNQAIHDRFKDKFKATIEYPKDFKEIFYMPNNWYPTHLNTQKIKVTNISITEKEVEELEKNIEKFRILLEPENKISKSNSFSFFAMIREKKLEKISQNTFLGMAEYLSTILMQKTTIEEKVNSRIRLESDFYNVNLKLYQLLVTHLRSILEMLDNPEAVKRLNQSAGENKPTNLNQLIDILCSEKFGLKELIKEKFSNKPIEEGDKTFVFLSNFVAEKIKYFFDTEIINSLTSLILDSVRLGINSLNEETKELINPYLSKIEEIINKKKSVEKIIQNINKLELSTLLFFISFMEQKSVNSFKENLESNLGNEKNASFQLFIQNYKNIPKEKSIFKEKKTNFEINFTLDLTDKKFLCYISQFYFSHFKLVLETKKRSHHPIEQRQFIAAIYNKLENYAFKQMKEKNNINNDILYFLSRGQSQLENLWHRATTSEKKKVFYFNFLYQLSPCFLLDKLISQDCSKHYKDIEEAISNEASLEKQRLQCVIQILQGNINEIAISDKGQDFYEKQLLLYPASFPKLLDLLLSTANNNIKSILSLIENIQKLFAGEQQFHPIFNSHSTTIKNKLDMLIHILNCSENFSMGKTELKKYTFSNITRIKSWINEFINKPHTSDMNQLLKQALKNMISVFENKLNETDSSSQHNKYAEVQNEIRLLKILQNNVNKSVQKIGVNQPILDK